MSDTLFELMKRTSIFVIIAQAIIHFRPNEAYEKYLRLLVGIMMTAVLFLPVLQIFSKESGADFKREMTRYEMKMEQMLKKAEEEEQTLSMGDFESNYLPALEKEIAERLKGQGVSRVTVTAEGAVILYLSGKEAAAAADGTAVKQRCARLLGMQEENLEVRTDELD